MAESIPNTKPILCGRDGHHFSEIVQKSTFGASNSTASSLADLINLIDKLDKCVSFAEMTPSLNAVILTDEEIRDLFIPNQATYSRSSVRKTRFAELVAITWLPEQASPIHDHAESACGVKVIDGIALETRFVPIGGDLAAPVEQLVHRSGEVFGGGGSDDLHIVANNSPVSTLRTLHLYSPPLQKEAMKVFRQFLSSSHPSIVQSPNTDGVVSQ